MLPALLPALLPAPAVTGDAADGRQVAQSVEHAGEELRARLRQGTRRRGGLPGRGVVTVGAEVVGFEDGVAGFAIRGHPFERSSGPAAAG